MEHATLKKMGASDSELEALKKWQEEAESSEEQELRHMKWMQKRIGKFTASSFHKLMTYEDNLDKFAAGAETHVEEKVIEELTGLPISDFKSDAMAYGSEMEAKAIEAFTAKTGIATQGIKDEFIEMKGRETFNKQDIDLSEFIGCSPDDLIGADSGLETKCPNSKTHLEYMLNISNTKDLKRIKKEYYWQIQGSMMVTGRKSWYFVSFDDRFRNEKLRILVIRIDRNEEDIAKLKYRLMTAIEKKIEKLQYINEVSGKNTIAGKQDESQ